jgi:hypothetical protein
MRRSSPLRWQHAPVSVYQDTADLNLQGEPDRRLQIRACSSSVQIAIATLVRRLPVLELDSAGVE